MPDGVKPILITDAGFRAPWFKAVNRLGWHWIGRIRNRTYLRPHASSACSLDHRAEAVAYALAFARDMGHELADRFVGMYVNHWTLDYGDQGRESIRRFPGRAHALGLIPRAPELEFVSEN